MCMSFIGICIAALPRCFEICRLTSVLASDFVLFLMKFYVLLLQHSECKWTLLISSISDRG